MRRALRWSLPLGVLAAFVLLVKNDLDKVKPLITVSRNNLDANCYFAVTHSVWFDHDFNLTNQFARMEPNYSLGPGWLDRQITGLPGSPFALGTSLLELPFFVAGTQLDRSVGFLADGYGPLTILTYCFGQWCFLAFASWILFGFLERLTREHGASESAASWCAWLATAGVLMGTMVMYYTLLPMSHAAGFLSVTLFLSYWHRIRRSDSLRHWLIAGAFTGLMVLCRWQNALFLLAPLVDWLLNRRSFLVRLSAGLPAVLILSPQFLEWKTIYGGYLLIPQGKGYLSFPPDHFFDLLFSGWNGLLVWTPLTGLGLAGLGFACWRRSLTCISLSTAFLAQMILIGGLPDWHGDLMGMRYLTCSMPVIGAGFVYLLAELRPWQKAAFLGVSMICGVYTGLFFYQWQSDLIPRRQPVLWREAVTDKLTIRQGLARRDQRYKGLKMRTLEEETYWMRELKVKYPEDRMIGLRLATLEHGKR